MCTVVFQIADSDISVTCHSTQQDHKARQMRQKKAELQTAELLNCQNCQKSKPEMLEEQDQGHQILIPAELLELLELLEEQARIARRASQNCQKSKPENHSSLLRNMNETLAYPTFLLMWKIEKRERDHENILDFLCSGLSSISNLFMRLPWEVWLGIFLC